VVYSSDFDIRVFHDELLEDGALPPNLPAKKIDQWIESQLH